MKIYNSIKIGILLIAMVQYSHNASSATDWATDDKFITTIEIDSSQNTLLQRTPITFGQLFIEGDVPHDYTVKAIDNDLHEIPLQIDIKARHEDASIRHAIISAMVVGAQPHRIRLYKQAVNAATVNQTLSSLPQPFRPYKNQDLQSEIQLTINDKNYKATLDRSALNCNRNTDTLITNFCRLLAPPQQPDNTENAFLPTVNWLNGAIVQEIGIPVHFKDEQDTLHPHLMARFFIRKYLYSNNIRLDITIENNWTYAANPQNFQYDVTILINNKQVFTQPGLTHYHHARWRKLFWTEETPGLHLKHDTRYLIKTKALPNYDQSLNITEDTLKKRYDAWNEYIAIPMTVGPATQYMPKTGAHEDIGPLPIWAVHYLLTMDARTKNITLATADMAGTWSIHYRDQTTDLPVSLVHYPYLSTHWNLKGQGPHPVPFCVKDCKSPYSPDEAHQPSFAFLPYAVTGDYYYLEELQFWANWNAFGTEPTYRKLDQALVKWQQLRGMAWTLRSLGQTAYITPDSHQLKSYFVNQINNNINYFNTRYTDNPNTNKLGVITDGYSLSTATSTASWEQAFFTWSIGYLADLGFRESERLLSWNAKFLTNRFTSPDYCWIAASAYHITVRNSQNAPIYTDFKTVYKRTVPFQARICGAMPTDVFKTLPEPEKTQTEDILMTNCECNSPAMIKNYKDIKKVGEMVGYSDSPAGYPSNMQPALAILSDYSLDNAKESWAIFNSRTVKPDYAPYPVWAIVPR